MPPLPRYPRRVLRALLDSNWKAARAAVFLAAVVAFSASASRAYAHPLVDEGYRRYSEADFSGALDSFARAWSARGLQRDDVVRVLAGRAMVYFATNDRASLQAALASLAVLEPTYAFPREAPPELAQGLDREVARARGTLGIEVTVEWRGEDAMLSSRVSHDPSRIVSAVRLYARVSGARPLTGEGTLLVPGARDGVSYWAEAIGPGGAVLATEGSESAPREAQHDGVALGVIEDPSGGGATADTGGGVSPWLWVGIGAVVVIGVIGTLLLVSSGGKSDSTQPGAPFVL